MKRIVVLFVAMFALCAVANAQSEFNFDEMMKIRRVGSPQISPDGKLVAFTITDVNVASNKSLTHIYLISIDGKNQQQITSGDKSNSLPNWSPDGKLLAFITGGQIWTMNADGSGKKQITSISTGAGNPVWSPDGKSIAFSSEVYPECSNDECNKLQEEKSETSKVQAKVTDRLLYRHWNEWRDRKRAHVFVVSSDGGVARDVTPGDFDSPPYAASSASDYSFSPDSKEIAYLRNPDKVEAVSTNSDIFIARLDGSGPPTNITKKNLGYDASPSFTGGGKYIIFRSQAKQGFEADRWRIMRYDRKSGEIVELTKGFDLQADDFVISPDNKIIYFTAGKRGASPIFKVPVETNLKSKTSQVMPLIESVENSANSLSLSKDGKTLVFGSSAMNSPASIMKASSTGSGVQSIVNANTEFESKFKLAKPESFEWIGAESHKIHGFLLKPANFDPTKQYPLLVLIHGGPQGAWGDSWNFRWNAALFANAGYVVFMPNPRGSTGYGQKFVDEISGDWGGKVFGDLMNGVAEVSQKPYINKNLIAGAGASYGGYMINWILGHNNDKRFKFRALVSHAGIFNMDSFAAATEELWFPIWDFKGMPWESRESYEKWSPHKFVSNFDTPTLVTAGELDYRVPIGESLQLFTALQRRNVDSRLLYFPDEGHWVMKPQNSELWYKEVLGWLGKHLK
jgi:dipeptidyl aminopeptidase/acylaminoacyl peptidase